MSEISKHFDAFRTGNHNGMEKCVRDIDRIFDVLDARTGKNRFQFEDAPNANPQSSLHKISSKAPPAASFSVTGVDGKFVIAIVNPENVLPASVGILQARATVSLNTHHAPI